MHIRSFYLVAVLASFHVVAGAQVFKCKTAAGGFVFQGTPCEDEGDSLGKKRTAQGNRGAVPVRKYDGPGANWDVNRPVTVVDRSAYAPPQQNPPPVIATQAPPSHSARPTRPHESLKQQDPRQAQAVSEMMALNKQQRCNSEMQQLDVVKNGRIIYTNDKQGNRLYVEDADRQSRIAAAQRKVASACN
ncbi:MAG: hypothetical protein V4627_00920 [Pseudomonadota bacterium]